MLFNKSFWFGAAVGAAAMYLLDPDSGEQRRRRTEEQARRLAEEPAVQQATGAVIDATRPVHDTGPDSDPALANKVRSEVLGQEPYADLDLNVAAHDGVVTLRGRIDDQELRRQLVETISLVGGVDRVEDLLHAPGETPPNMAQTG